MGPERGPPGSPHNSVSVLTPEMCLQLWGGGGPWEVAFLASTAFLLPKSMSVSHRWSVPHWVGWRREWREELALSPPKDWLEG